MRSTIWPLIRVGIVTLVLVGCQVRTEVTVDMEDDGSGTVQVAVGLDAEAIRELPDLDKNSTSDAADLVAMVRADDLRATGWTIGEPRKDADDYTWITATKAFGTPIEAAAVLNEITGGSGPLRDWELSRSHGFGKTTYEISGTADLSGGIEVFGDAGLAAALDGEPLGEDAAAIEQRYGKPLSELFTLEIKAELPGGTKTWTPVLGSAAETLDASTTQWNTGVLALTAIAVGCVLGLIALFVVRTLRAS